MTIYGRPTNIPFIANMEDLDVAYSPGGRITVVTAHQALKIGDSVFLSVGGRADKSLDSSLYAARFLGVVVGGKVTDYQATNASTLVGTQVAAAGEAVVIQRDGICFVAADAVTNISAGDPISAGRTTAGRARSDLAYSVATSVAGLAIKAGASAIVKAVNVTNQLNAGIVGTATTANQDMGALAGTVTNGKFNVFLLRIAAAGTSTTTNMGTEGTTLNDVVLPAGTPTVTTIGILIIHPTGVGNFVGGTTALDDATVIPNAVYIDLLRTRLSIGMALQGYTAPVAGDPIKIMLS